MTAPSTHTESEDHRWTVNIVDHPMRKESSAFTRAKKAAHKILATLSGESLPYGEGPWQMHHGGSIWVSDAAGWHLYLGRAGIEWSMQFCANPTKVELLRQDVVRLLDAFPKTGSVSIDVLAGGVTAVNIELGTPTDS